MLSGRSAEYGKIASELRSGSNLLLVGPRRIGKTELLKLLCASPPYETVAVRVDLEGLGTVASAVERVSDALIRAKLIEASWVAKTWKRISSLTVKGVAIQLHPETQGPWELLEQCLRKTLAVLGSKKHLALLLDEVPWWLDALGRIEGNEAARAALARLRFLRQLEGLAARSRWVFTGSMGLSSLAQKIDAVAEINDLTTMLLGPLPEEDGTALFEAELLARELNSSAETSLAAYHRAGGSPHWIKQIAVKVTGARGASVAPDAIDRAVDRLLSPQMRHLFHDEGHAHLVRRHPSDVKLLKTLLAAAAEAEEPLSRTALVSEALNLDSTLGRSGASRAIYVLEDEFYLEESYPGGPLRFCNPLFRDWWLRYGSMD